MMDEKHKILDIAMNLNRIGNWAADDFLGKKPRILLFMKQTSDYLNHLSPKNYPPALKNTLTLFLNEFRLMSNEVEQLPDQLLWAEKMMTWGNILTHRAQLLKP